MMLFYPAKDEYRQALFGALDYFATWLAWEKEPELKGKDAARAWRQAVEATRECIEMNTCETMLTLLRDIRANTGNYCCDTADISDGDQYTDEVQDGVDTVPQNIVDAGYADDVDDWDSFYDYKCMISHLMVSNMQGQTAKFLQYTDETGAVIGALAAVAAIAAAILFISGAVLVLGIVLAIGGAAVLYEAISQLGRVGLASLIDNLEEHHDELACAIFDADGSAGAVVALSDTIDELFNPAEAVYLKALNLPAQLKALYSGRYDQQDIAEIMEGKGLDPASYDCTCEFWDHVYIDNWRRGQAGAGQGNYYKLGSYGWNSGAVATNPDCWWLGAGSTNNGHLYKNYDSIVADLPISSGTPVRIMRVEIDYELKWDITGWIRLAISYFNGGWNMLKWHTHTGLTGIGTTGTLLVDLTIEESEIVSDNFIKMEVDTSKTGGSGNNSFSIRYWRYHVLSE
jgi:hypothetical protein